MRTLRSNALIVVAGSLVLLACGGPGSSADAGNAAGGGAGGGAAGGSGGGAGGGAGGGSGGGTGSDGGLLIGAGNLTGTLAFAPQSAVFYFRTESDGGIIPDQRLVTFFDIDVRSHCAPGSARLSGPYRYAEVYLQGDFDGGADPTSNISDLVIYTSHRLADGGSDFGAEDYVPSTVTLTAADSTRTAGSFSATAFWVSTPDGGTAIVDGGATLGGNFDAPLCQELAATFR